MAEPKLHLSVAQQSLLHASEQCIIFNASSAGTLHALAFWWMVNLTDDVCISTCGSLAGLQVSPKPSHWRQSAVLIPNDGIKLNVGDKVQMKQTATIFDI